MENALIDGKKTKTKKTFYARKSPDGKRKQLVADHINGVVNRIKEWSGGSATETLAGFAHDPGKYRELWQEYFDDPFSKRGEVPHALSGVALILKLSENYLKTHEEDLPFHLTRDSLTYAIAAHHGVFDAVTPGGKGELHNKMKKAQQDETRQYEEALQNYQEEFDINYLNDLFAKSVEEAEQYIKALMNKESLKSTCHFYFGFYVRMVLSSLIDGDWSDAGDFATDKKRPYATKPDWKTLSANLEAALKALPQESAIDCLRGQISDACKQAGKRPPGVYQMGSPVGSGKTLSTMRLSLVHLMEYKKVRIFYISPFISILEQNAQKYKDALSSEDLQAESFILEHHSNVLLEEGDQKDFYQYFSSNWSAPIVLTTMVQFLNTLFSKSMMSWRRLHNLRNSVIIIDEYQSVPTKCQALFNLAINALSEFYGATVILCTATQPPFEEDIKDRYLTGKAVPKIEMQDDPALIPDYSNEKGFERIRIRDKRTQKGYNCPEFASLVTKRLKHEKSLLVILNTRKAVNMLYYELIDKKGKQLKDTVVYVLSNNMTPAHRIETLLSLKEDLETKKVLCISTQLIEAGVDISFTGAIRSLAGLDSLIQTGGRVCRDGSDIIGEVWVVNLTSDFENLEILKEIRWAQEAATPVLNDFAKNPEKYNHKLDGKVAIEQYFKNYFSRDAAETHYPVYLTAEQLETSLLRLLSKNQDGVDSYKERTGSEPDNLVLHQAFRTVGEYFCPIDDNKISLLVPWGKGKEAIEALQATKMAAWETENLLRRAQRHCVQVSPYQMKEVERRGGLIYLLEGKVAALKEGYYDEVTGFNKDGVPRESAV